MFSLTKIRTTLLFVSASLLCTSPLAAAIKTKPSTTRVKARTSVSASKQSASSASRNSSKAVASSSRRGRKAKLQSSKARKPKFRGQQSIDQARTIEIQQALIREHYLDGEPTGEWDQATREALTRFQGDNHWQTKILPDSRALIKLGLGPSQQNLLNPESAAIAMPYRSALDKPSPGGSN